MSEWVSRVSGVSKGVSGALQSKQASEWSAAEQTSEQTSGPFLQSMAQKEPEHLEKRVYLGLEAMPMDWAWIGKILKFRQIFYFLVAIQKP